MSTLAPDALAALPSALPGADHFSEEREGPSLAHDLRNLLSGIQTTLDVLDIARKRRRERATP